MRGIAGILIRVPIPEIISTIFRVDPTTGLDTGLLVKTIQQIPTTYTQNRPREASPTGKSGMGVATYSIAPQAIHLARNKTVLTPNANKNSGHLIETGTVNPYDGVKVQRTPFKNVKLAG